MPVVTAERDARTPLADLLGRVAGELPEGIDSPVREIARRLSRIESQIADSTERRGKLWEEGQNAVLEDLNETLEGLRAFVEDPVREVRRRVDSTTSWALGVGRSSGDGEVVPIEGRVEPGFEPVAEAFQRNFERRDELGAAVCVYVHGRPVVDLWGGHRDLARTKPWREDTMALVFSATKGLTATCIHLLAERGLLELDAPVSDFWPEFADAGKSDILVRQVLTHEAGLPIVDGSFSNAEVFAWHPVVDAIAAQRPAWKPGRFHGYHPRSFGWILGELVRRVTGLSLGGFLAAEIARPLGIDFYVGLGAEHEHRVAEIRTPRLPANPIAGGLQQLFMGRSTQLGRALSGPGDLGYGPVWNSRELHAAEMPSSNGIGSARALARHYAALIGEVDGVRLLEEQTVERAREMAVRGRDKLLQIPTRFGLGYMLPPSLGTACRSSAFGHPGAGGSLAFADPLSGLAVGFVVNRMEVGLTGDPRSSSVVEAVYDCL